MNHPEGERTEILFQLQEELARLDACGAPIDASALAARFGVTQAEVERSLAGLAALAKLAPPTEAGGSPAPADPPLAPPPLPSDYELLGEIGRGGMGVVYKAHQRSLDRVIAVKVLRPGDLLLGDLLRRFRKEARSLARLRHPHIVSIHEVGDAGGLVYLTMDFIDGEPLSELVRRADLTPTRAVRLLRQVASAIAYSHGQGIVHRDLKPGNVLVDARGDAFVVDFGLARDTAGAGDHTVSGQILGTPAYMSPEQARGDGQAIGECSDVYALGAILYECLTGRPPFAHKGLAELVHAVLYEEPKAPRRLRPDLPLDLELICRKAMAKEPERRYATANALLEDLERFHDGRPVRARPPSLGYRSARFVRRHWRALALGSAVAAALVAAFIAVVLPMVRPPAAATVAAAVALAERGEHRAALMLFDRARDEAGAPQVLDGLRGHAVAADLALVRRELAAATPDLRSARQLLENAATDAIAMVGDEGRTAVVEQAWELAAKAEAASQDDLTTAATDVVDRILAACAAGSEQRPDFFRVMASAFGTKGDPRQLLARLLPGLRNAGDPLHAVATNYLVDHLVDPFGNKRQEVTAWLLAEVERDPHILAPLFDLVDRLDEDPRTRLIQTFSGERLDRLLRRAAGQAMLAEFAGDETLGPLARTVAANLLARKADLPFWAPHDPERMDVPLPAPEVAATVVALWREVVDLDHVAGFERRVAAALAETVLCRVDGRRWLYEHTLGAPGQAFDHGSPAAWRQWWATAANVAPQDRLAIGLGLSTAEREDLPGLLQRFLVARDHQRAGLHHLLALQLRDQPLAELPAGPFDERAPELWWRAVHGDAPTPQYELRVAAIAWRDGEAEPQLAWEDTRIVHLFEAVSHERIAALPPLPVAFGAPRVPGFDTTVQPTSGRSEERIQDLQVRWTVRGQVELVPEGSAIMRLVRVHVHSREAAMWRLCEGRIGVAVDTGVSTWADQRGGHRMLCLCFAPVTARAGRPWGLAGFCAKVADALREGSSDLGRDPTIGDHYQEVADTANAIELATLIPVPAALADLQRMDAAIAQGRSAQSRLGDHLIRARLLLGDADVLRADPARFAAKVPVVAADDMDAGDDTRFWAHVLLCTHDVDLQREAARRLHAEHLTPCMAASIAALDRTARVGLTTAAARRVADANPFADAWLEPAGIAIPSLLALLLGGTACGIALLALMRRRRPGAGGAAVLIVGGVAIMMFDVAVAGTPLLPDAAGCALLAGGMWACHRQRIVPWLFGVAVATDLLAATGLPLCHSLTTTLVAVALAIAPFGNRQPFATRRRQIAWWLLTLLGLGTFLCGAGPTLIAEWHARIGFGMAAWTYWGDATWQWQRQLVPLLGVALLVLGVIFRPPPRAAVASAEHSQHSHLPAARRAT